MKALRKIAGPTIEFLGHVPQSILREHLARCRALLFPAYEDFGIVLVETMASAGRWWRLGAAARRDNRDRAGRPACCSPNKPLPR